MKLNSTVTERNLLYITSSPQTAERVSRDGCSATSLAQSCGRRGHRSTAAAVDVDAAILHEKTPAVKTFCSFRSECGICRRVFDEVNAEHRSVCGGDQYSTHAVTLASLALFDVDNYWRNSPTAYSCQISSTYCYHSTLDFIILALLIHLIEMSVYDRFCSVIVLTF